MLIRLLVVLIPADSVSNQAPQSSGLSPALRPCVPVWRLLLILGSAAGGEERGKALYRRAVPRRAGFPGCTPLPWHHPSVQMSQPAAKSRSGEQQPVHGSAEESSTPLIKAGSDFKQMCTAQLLLALLCAAARLGQFIGAASSVLVGSICADFVRWLV